MRNHRLEFPVGKVLYAGLSEVCGVRFSPDGRSLALFDSADKDTSLILVDLTGKKRVLTRGWQFGFGLAWHPSTNEIWFSARESTGSSSNLDVHAVSTSGRRRVVSRAPLSQVIYDVARDGRVLLAQADYTTRSAVLPPGAAQEVDLTMLDFASVSDLSDDGRTALVINEGQVNGAAGEVYLRKTDGSPPVRIGEGFSAVLSTDAKWVVSIAASKNSLLVFPTGTGESRAILGRDIVYRNVKWFPDGQRLLVEAHAPGRAARLYVQDLAGGSPRPVTPEGFGIGPVSPDGRLVATPGPEEKIFLYPLGGGEPRAIPGLGPEDRVMRWNAAGDALFLETNLPSSLRIDRLELATGRREPWKEIHVDPTGVIGIDAYVTPDGKSYAYDVYRQLSNLYVVDGLR